MRSPIAPSGLLDASGRAISQYEVARVRASAHADIFGEAYTGASQSGTFMSGWPAQLLSADRAWLPARQTATARVHDTTRNNPLGQSALSRKKNALIGGGWQIKFRPNATALGISLDSARALGRILSNEFKLYANSHNFLSDATRRRTFSQQLRTAAGHLMGDGEILGLSEWADDEEGRYKTRLRLVDPGRLSNPTGRMNGDLPGGGRIADGIEFNAADVPIRYHIREKHQSDWGSKDLFKWAAWDRWTSWGRPQVFHCFEVEREGQSRGVSRFVATLRSFRAFDKFTDATLQSATINALILGYMKSNSGPMAASENFEAKDVHDVEASRQAHYKESPVSLANGAVLPVIPYGDEIKLETASRDVTSFDAFARAIIRLIAAALGVTYEELSMDYSQTNYSSARAALIHAYADTLAMMDLMKGQLVRPFAVSWAEEAFDRGYVEIPDGAPDFYDAVDAYTEIHIIGPGKGVIDPTKEIDAAAARIETGVSTLEDECDELGKDWEEVLEQRVREDARKSELEVELGGSARDRVAKTSRDPAHDAAIDQRAA
jgi:lambda family phage portal protein